MWKLLEKRPFFRADMAGLGKYCMGGYGRIGVYRVTHFASGFDYIDSRKVKFNIMTTTRAIFMAKTNVKRLKIVKKDWQ